MKTSEFTLEHPCGLKISRQLKESDITSVDLIERRDMGNGYVWCDINAADICDKRVLISLCFFRGDLDRLNISLDNRDLYGTGWNEWSEVKERQRAKDSEDWLRLLGYNVGIYHWGEVWAGYDAKGASGGAGIRYKSA